MSTLTVRPIRDDLPFGARVGGVTLDLLADRAHMSRRSFTRQFRAETGRSPLDWLLEQRIVRARMLLETTTATVPAIALRAGLGSDAALRHHFRRVLGVSPTTYRRTFVGSEDEAGAR